MERNQFCAILEKEYQTVSEEWFQVTQQFGPPAVVWNWLHTATPLVDDHHKQIIQYLISIYKRKFNQLKDQLVSLSARQEQLLCAISVLNSPIRPYYHLSHFHEDEFQVYYTDGIDPDTSSSHIGDY